MSNIAILGHEIRGKEVIEILKMLGGKNVKNYEGYNTHRYYFIKDNWIDWCHEFTPESDFITFTLEEFFENFPYKVGDKVSSKFLKNCKIEKMKWTDITNRVIYNLQGIGWYSADELQPYKGENFVECVEATVQECLFGKEETMENKLDLLQQLKEYFENTPREIVEKEWHEYDKYNEISPKVNEYLEYVNNIRHHKYPKTYEECCEVLGICPNGDIVYAGNWVYGGEYLEKHLEKIRNFQKLLICRNAYWKIAGEENKGNIDYVICNTGGKIIKTNIPNSAYNHILNFPTEEMRDAFYENFKKEIEECKELL